MNDISVQKLISSLVTFCIKSEINFYQNIFGPAICKQFQQQTIQIDSNRNNSTTYFNSLHMINSFSRCEKELIICKELKISLLRSLIYFFEILNDCLRICRKSQINALWILLMVTL